MKACAWSLQDYATITGALFIDLTGEAGPSSVVKEEDKADGATSKDEADGGVTVKDEPLDFTVFDRYR